jgi:hypothetical protein
MSARENLYEIVGELARWSQVAARNGDLHARLASALALNDEDYSPAYQDEYQRLWHESRWDNKRLRAALSAAISDLLEAEGKPRVGPGLELAIETYIAAVRGGDAA